MQRDRVKCMKKIGILLISMLVLTCCLLYARERAACQQKELYIQREFAAENTYEAVEEGLLRKEQELGRTLAENCYAYHMLTAKQQRVYQEIYYALTTFSEEVRLSSCSTEEISMIFQCVMNDHPEIFYTDGYTYTEYTLGEKLRKITFSGVYLMGKEETERRQRQIDEYAAECLKGLPQEADEYEKVKYIYEYLIDHTEYDGAVSNNQNICSVFLEGRSVCQGYAKAMQYLLGKSGVYSTLVLGSVIHGDTHAWNLVRIDGEYYYVDVTWGDASYQNSGQEAETDPKGKPAINYDYLCVTTSQLEMTHRMDNVVPMPECTCMDANYYVRENAYFTAFDEERLQKLFQDAAASGEGYVTLKCASVDVYRKVRESLIEEQKIFRYMGASDGTVSYSGNEEQYSMSFWL